jgi:hypothetical protein
MYPVDSVLCQNCAFQITAGNPSGAPPCGLPPSDRLISVDDHAFGRYLVHSRSFCNQVLLGGPETPHWEMYSTSIPSVRLNKIWTYCKNVVLMIFSGCLPSSALLCAGVIYGIKHSPEKFFWGESVRPARWFCPEYCLLCMLRSRGHRVSRLNGGMRRHPGFGPYNSGHIVA